MAINFDLNDLLAFRAVVERGSFRKAASAVNISQPALSRRIEKLEDALGVKLFDRTNRQVSLTATGRAFAPSAQRILDDLDVALLGIKDVASTRTEKVTVACVPSAAYYFMPHVVAQFHSLYPRIRVTVLDGSANEVLGLVSGGEADFGLSFTAQQEPEIHFKPLLEERFVAACRKDHPLAKKKRVSWSEFYRYDYISLDKTSGNRLLLDQALTGLTPPSPSVCETRHVTTMIGLVEAGMGIAAVPSIAMPIDEHLTLMSVPLVEPVVTRRVGLISRKGRTRTPAADALYEMVVAMQKGRRTPRAKTTTS
ncbi:MULTISPECIES: LysR family transcriptional regulator [unclassified Paraburkholderia]|uniref:LysR family transcriptional regulator n=1 Tax=unclassified Paraburkholderia TaxID=2615204 RepID=UPI002AB0A814|nr:MULTISPECIES: LysR family transcriptional regulator [unclassified Paraburkholderia]